MGALLHLLSDPSPVPRRLPLDVVPLHYTLDFIPVHEEDSFSGREVIILKTVNSTRKIALHARDLLIDCSTLSLTELSTGNKMEVTGLEEERQNNWVVISLASEMIENQEYSLEIQYSGTITSYSHHGILKHNYDDAKNRWIIFTHFEPVGARFAFPCFDEPSFKAQFNISVATPPSLHALSNMPLREASEPVAGLPGWVWSRFEESVPMSTYLVGFVVSDLVSVRGDRNFTVWVPQGREAEASVMVQYGPIMLAAFEEFTGLPTALPKQDNVAIPYMTNLGSVLGTENWGIITYTDETVLLNEHEATSWKKRMMAHILAHELAHNWFGNLVTPHFWDELWLKEGIARYLQYYISGKVLPTWEMENDFQIYVLQRSLFAKEPSLLNQPAETPLQMAKKYNIRTYDTGAVLIHMLQHVLTAETFLAGIRQYLTTYAYRSATSEQFFEIMDSAAANATSHTLPPGVRVGDFMRPWLYQTRHPLVIVTRNYSSGDITICQVDTDKGDQRWWIPLSYTTQSELDFSYTAPRLWLSANESCTHVSGLAEPHHWIIFNIQQTGYYRVNYDAHNWQLLASFLNSDEFHQIHIMNRVQLLDDVLRLLEDGQLVNEELANSITKYLVREKSIEPWFIFIKSAPGNRMNRSSVLEMMEPFYALIEGLPANIPLRNAPHLWGRSLDSSCVKPMMPKCVDDAFKHLKTLQENPATYKLHPDIQDVVFCHALRHNNSTGEDVTFLWHLAQSMKNPTYLLLNLQWCAIETVQVHSLIVVLVTDGAWLTSQERGAFIWSVCRKRPNLQEVLAVLKARYVDTVSLANLHLLEIITTAMGSFPSLQREYSQLWCVLFLNWLTGGPLSMVDNNL